MLPASVYIACTAFVPALVFSSICLVPVSHAHIVPVNTPTTPAPLILYDTGSDETRYSTVHVLLVYAPDKKLILPVGGTDSFCQVTDAALHVFPAVSMSHTLAVSVPSFNELTSIPVILNHVSASVSLPVIELAAKSLILYLIVAHISELVEVPLRVIQV